MAAQGPGVDDGAPAPSVDLRRLRVGTATARCARGSAAWTRAVVLGRTLREQGNLDGSHLGMVYTVPPIYGHLF